MTTLANLGFPRIGASRELKWALEHAWRNRRYDDLRSTGASLRTRHWMLQHGLGIERVPVGDFSLYDHVLDAALAVGAVPERFGGKGFDPASGHDHDLERYFAMARGSTVKGVEHAPLELTKWFDTNYHYLVPELVRDQCFTPQPERLLGELREIQQLGIDGRVVLLGPVSLLRLSKCADGGDPLELLDRLLPAYSSLVADLRAAGAHFFQIDEPLLVTDLDDAATAAYPASFASIRAAAGNAEVTLATYFGPLRENLAVALSLPVDVLHLDLVRGRRQLTEVLARRPPGLGLSLGVVDGRNVWRSDLDTVVSLVEDVVQRVGQSAVHLAPSCSLLHLPVTIRNESRLDAELLSWMAFASERLEELHVLGAIADGAATAVAVELGSARAAVAARQRSPRIHRPEVMVRLAMVTPEMRWRTSPYVERRSKQAVALDLPCLPTTTIGSFPQTAALRATRQRFRNDEITVDQYLDVLRREIEVCVREQEALGLDVLVHGEFERTDMVEYFGDLLEGFCVTDNGWVQSYGSRCVKPPVLFGDVARVKPMTLDWTTFAANLTERPMKAMLTGPVTILQWSFVRDDVPRAVACQQIALALRDEVDDLVAASVPIIQVDEPALREGLPLRRADQAPYLSWATEAFRLATASVPDEVQIHTHMCYAEFGDIARAIFDLDADVISVEASRSRMELLGDLAGHVEPNAIGPGLWDIHSPRVPTDAELDGLLHRAIDAFGAERLWVNPDCGLKTRGWEETRRALAAMVSAAMRAREAIDAGYK